MKKLFMMFLFLTVIATSTQAEDTRQVIWLTAEQKNLLMQEMRHFLQASQTILGNSLNEDLESIEKTARSVGIKAMKATPQSLNKILPQAFLEIGPKVHLGFEEIANEASGIGDIEVILKRLTGLQSNCIECHAQYQIKVK